MRVIGDNCWLDKKDFVDYENKVDVVINKSHIISLCQYNLNTCSTTEIIDVVSSHQFTLIKRNGKWERIENFGRKRAKDNSEGKIIENVCFFRDINKLKQEEHRIRRYNRILKGINYIFSSVVQVKTEEELGEACQCTLPGLQVHLLFLESLLQL